MYTKYYTNTKVAKLSQEYLNASIHSYKSNRIKRKPNSIIKTPLNQRNYFQNQKHKKPRNVVTLNLAMNNIAKIQDTMVSKPKISTCYSMSNIENKQNEDYDQNDSNEIINKTFQPEPMPRKVESRTDVSFQSNESKLLYTLRTLDLESLFSILNLNSISFNDLFLLSKEDLLEMKIPLGPRNRLLHFAGEYKQKAKEFDMRELKDFFQNNKCFLINKVEHLTIQSLSSQNWNKGNGQRYYNSNQGNNSIVKKSNESYYSNNNFNDDLNNNQTSISQRSRKNNEYNNCIKHQDNQEQSHQSLIEGLANYNSQNSCKQVNFTNNPKSNHSFTHYANQRYEPGNQFPKAFSNNNKPETRIYSKNNEKISVKNNRQPNPSPNNKSSDGSKNSSPSIQPSHIPITFANYNDHQRSEFDYNQNDNDLESVICYDDKISNQNKSFISTNATLKQPTVTKCKNKSHLMEHANNIFAEVENFQQQYENMKIINNQRKNKVNLLLKKKDPSDNQKDFHGHQSRPFCNNQLKYNKNMYTGEAERNLNEELKKIYNLNNRNLASNSSIYKGKGKSLSSSLIHSVNQNKKSSLNY